LSPAERSRNDLEARRPRTMADSAIRHNRTICATSYADRLNLLPSNH
jgi:hypothetical protein